jgi:hypothetical protein
MDFLVSKFAFKCNLYHYTMDFPYRENSAPWFGYRKVVKGGCWATSAPVARAGYRHSFWPEMNAVYTAGLRGSWSTQITRSLQAPGLVTQPMHL